MGGRQHGNSTGAVTFDNHDDNHTAAAPVRFAEDFVIRTVRDENLRRSRDGKSVFSSGTISPHQWSNRGARVLTRVRFHRGPLFHITAHHSASLQHRAVAYFDGQTPDYATAVAPRHRLNLYEWRRCDGDRAQCSRSLDLFVRWRYFFGSCSRHVINKSEHDVLDMPRAPYPPSHAEVSF